MNHKLLITVSTVCATAVLCVANVASATVIDCGPNFSTTSVQTCSTDLGGGNVDVQFKKNDGAKWIVNANKHGAVEGATVSTTPGGVTIGDPTNVCATALFSEFKPKGDVSVTVTLAISLNGQIIYNPIDASSGGTQKVCTLVMPGNTIDGWKVYTEAIASNGGQLKMTEQVTSGAVA